MEILGHVNASDNIADLSVEGLCANVVAAKNLKPDTA